MNPNGPTRFQTTELEENHARKMSGPGAGILRDARVAPFNAATSSFTNALTNNLDLRITATVPADATSGPITIETPHGRRAGKTGGWKPKTSPNAFMDYPIVLSESLGVRYMHLLELQALPPVFPALQTEPKTANAMV